MHVPEHEFFTRSIMTADLARRLRLRRGVALHFYTANQRFYLFRAHSTQPVYDRPSIFPSYHCRFDADGANSAIENVGDLLTELILHMLWRRRTYISKGVGAWCGNRKCQLFEKGAGERMIRAADPYTIKAGRDDVRDKICLSK